MLWQDQWQIRKKINPTESDRIWMTITRKRHPHNTIPPFLNTHNPINIRISIPSTLHLPPFDCYYSNLFYLPSSGIFDPHNGRECLSACVMYSDRLFLNRCAYNNKLYCVIYYIIVCVAFCVWHVGIIVTTRHNGPLSILLCTISTVVFVKARILLVNLLDNSLLWCNSIFFIKKLYFGSNYI